MGGREGEIGRILATHPLPVLSPPFTELLLSVTRSKFPPQQVTPHLGRLTKSRETQCGTSPRGAWSGQPNRPISQRDISSPPLPASAEPCLDSLTLSSGMRFLCTLRGTDDAEDACPKPHRHDTGGEAIQSHWKYTDPSVPSHLQLTRANIPDIKIVQDQASASYFKSLN